MAPPSPSKGLDIPIRSGSGSDSRRPSNALSGSPLSSSPFTNFLQTTTPNYRTLDSEQIAALRAQYETPNVQQIPRSTSISRPGSATPGTPANIGAVAAALGRDARDLPTSIEELTDAQKAKIVKLHLPNLEVDEEVVAEGDSGVQAGANSADPGASSISQTNYSLQGYDTTQPLYKWASSATQGVRSRSASFHSTSRNPNQDPLLDIQALRQPQGFRRNFVTQRQRIEGREGDATSTTRSFVDFLSLYGHFGGEDLEEIEEESEEDLEAAEDEVEEVEEPTERTSLLRRSESKFSTKRRRRSASLSKHQGDATVAQAVLMLLKSFIGTGVLFLGKAFYNGGMLFSALMIVFIAMISLYSFLLLVKTRTIVPGSFGEIGGVLYGPWLRFAILFSIVLSQIGFVCAYLIFVSENLQAFFLAVTDRKLFIPIVYLIFGQLIVFLPLAMIRNIQKLSGTALVADAFILVGLVYLFGNEIKVIVDRGIAPVKAFNPVDWNLLVGTAIFSFEGIGLVIPITESMKQPEKFPRALSGVMVFLMVLFGGAGALAYAAYGDEIKPVIFLNLPQDDKLVNASQFLYSLAIMLSAPLQLFPAVRIMENGLFSKSGKYSNMVKWEKNIFRTGVVVGCALISWIGSQDLDKFVSLIGSFACVPLCFCYPALLHYKARAETRTQKAADIALFIFGLVACCYTTFNTVDQWIKK
ncbi:hypothetical protein BT69DRAFT_1349923 [Atractiella rhizophila]|nr:hypothetical protein BT69DRAFT_1349923 [Atractiella rhizophila]